MRHLSLAAFSLALLAPVAWASWPAGGLYPPPHGPCATSVWNSADTTATVTLDDCAVTATLPNTAGLAFFGSRSTNHQSTGKFYWETTDPGGTLSSGVGFGDASVSLTSGFLGSTATGWGYFSGGSVQNNNTIPTTVAIAATGDTVKFAVDLDTQHCWIKINSGNWNNNASGDPATDAIPFFCNRFADLYAIAIFQSNSSGAAASTATFNAVANTPSGFTTGIPAGGTAYVAGHTWSPLDMGGKLTVSNGRLTAKANAAGYSVVRSALSVSSGKYYWEITATTITAGFTGFGIADATQSLTTFLGSTGNHSVGWETAGVWRNNANQGSIGTYTNGDTLSVALDIGNAKIWFRKNCGNWNNAAIGSQDPANNVGGFTIAALTGPFYAAANTASGTSTDVFTANFGATAFGCTAPTGFTAGP